MTATTTTRTVSCLIPDGTTIYTGRNWSSKWSRTEWIVKDGMAHPVKRHHFWCSVAGKVEDVSHESPKAIVSETSRWSGRLTYTSTVEDNGTAFSTLFA